MKLTACPIDLAEANAFVTAHHRHHAPVIGHKFSIGASLGDLIVGVVSRADLKADYAKDKWIEYLSGAYGTPRELRPRRLWPRQVWKHFYAVPQDVWSDDLLPHLGSPNSGVLLLREDKDGSVQIRCHRRTKPNRDAKTLTPTQVLDVARLASLRLWNTYDALTRAHEDNRRIRAMYDNGAPA